MANLVISPLGTDDLRGIWAYTRETWDEEQAERYVRSIHAAMARLATVPKLGNRASKIRKGYSKYPVGSHVIFFKRTKAEVIVIRVLHQSMDFKRHIK
jgi:toxin ParE1/3/4